METENEINAVVIVENNKEKSDKVNVRLIRFEEFALSLEEHFHAQQLFAKNPNQKPLGHR
jgi:hypothetical protein|tara:strand:+ start:185 stop:364 length:180 start_codon:yes stop_codon:yes gene_type:complete